MTHRVRSRSRSSSSASNCDRSAFFGGGPLWPAPVLCSQAVRPARQGGGGPDAGDARRGSGGRSTARPFRRGVVRAVFLERLDRQAALLQRLDAVDKSAGGGDGADEGGCCSRWPGCGRSGERGRRSLSPSVGATAARCGSTRNTLNARGHPRREARQSGVGCNPSSGFPMPLALPTESRNNQQRERRKIYRHL
jgi:hypothetical protein